MNALEVIGNQQLTIVNMQQVIEKLGQQNEGMRKQNEAMKLELEALKLKVPELEGLKPPAENEAMKPTPRLTFVKPPEPENNLPDPPDRVTA